MRLAVAIVALASIAAAGCARAIEVGSADPRLNYGIDVRNEMAVTMLVSYSDGRADALLGAVEPGRTERFIIASPAATTITVTARSQDGGRSSGPHSVSLAAGHRPLVLLR